MFSIYSNDSPSSTTLVLKGEREREREKHVSKLLLMDTDTAKTAMIGWRAQALALRTKAETISSFHGEGWWCGCAVPCRAAPRVY